MIETFINQFTNFPKYLLFNFVRKTPTTRKIKLKRNTFNFSLVLGHSIQIIFLLTLTNLNYSQATMTQDTLPQLNPNEPLDDPTESIEKIDPWAKKPLEPEINTQEPSMFPQLLGIHLTYSADSMLTKFTAGSPTTPKTVEAKMKGSGAAVGVYYEKFVSDRLSILGGIGFDQLYVDTHLQEKYCDSQTSTHCYVSIQFLATYGMTKYYLFKSSASSMWFGIGGSFLFALTKSSSVLDTHRMGATGLYLTSLGMNFNLNKANRFIPLEIGYSVFPPISTIATSRFFLRAGYGWRF